MAIACSMAKNCSAGQGVAMKHIAYSPILAVMLSMSFTAIAEVTSDRPAGVAAADWVPVSKNLGIVLFHRKAPAVSPSDQALLFTPPVDGYFMVKIVDGWTRLVIIEPRKGPADIG
jgi:hypothetical protein